MGEFVMEEMVKKRGVMGKGLCGVLESNGYDHDIMQIWAQSISLDEVYISEGPLIGIALLSRVYYQTRAPTHTPLV
ncbi:uncharacterized protein G2W53_024429 [Senna tora]|uniref:Uncharacterized protein n=1 Tax=Senna tora TaxID=362788 RepID=A0A834WJ26_9FABA|nr:uncharacterized protein G2W53_024429 [Senna tora]